MERTELAKDKTGVFTGAYAVNPVNGKKIPVWISDYILISYGTGAIMAVPGARRAGLRVREEVRPAHRPGGLQGRQRSHELAAADPTDGDRGQLRASSTGLPPRSSRSGSSSGWRRRASARSAVNYKLRDWIFSRQRYWGEPIPLVHCPKDGTVAVPYDQLPLKLPEVKTVMPTGTGESPLAAITDWVNTTCPKCGGPAKRETNTMPQWAGSCWYYLRFLDPKNDTAFAAREKIDYWMPVDLYVGGRSTRCSTCCTRGSGTSSSSTRALVNTAEPFMRLINQGMILGEGGVKMSKSLGNVINPDDIVREYGADTMRVYEMFMGPLEVSKPWSTRGIAGAKRFLERIWRVGRAAAHR